jgi:hypothetical protein
VNIGLGACAATLGPVSESRALWTLFVVMLISALFLRGRFARSHKP